MSIAHTAYFGDGDYAFRLTYPMLKELEQKAGIAAPALFTRVFNRVCAVSDLHELIRCALIGGGMAPKRAAELIAAYAVDRPLIEIQPLAERIATVAYFGVPNE